MNLVKSNDPILQSKLEEFNFISPPTNPYDLAHDLVKFMYENNGLGLAANQVGLPYRVFAMRGHPENFVCFNPKVVYQSEEQISLDESCLSFPGLVVKVKRPKSIRVRFMTPNSDTLTKQFEGMSARIFLHEMDHLDGVIFYNKANKYHKEIAMKKWKRGELSEIKINLIGEYGEHILR